LIAPHGLLNQIFWHRINSSPQTAEGWDAVGFIASDPDMAARAKTHLRRMVEIVRAHLDPVMQRRNQLFQPSRDLR
jgi:hypothetical protein